jgi:hypothetical protein
MRPLTRRHAVLTLAAGLAACGRGGDTDAPPAGTLAWALAGDWRLQPERDQYRHPLQSLLFWGLEGDMTVLEILPGLGWYTAILAPLWRNPRDRCRRRPADGAGEQRRSRDPSQQCAHAHG